MNTYTITEDFKITVSGKAEDLLMQGKFKSIVKRIKKIIEQQAKEQI